MVFSCLAYFLVENREAGDAEGKFSAAAKRIISYLINHFGGRKVAKRSKSKIHGLKGKTSSEGSRLRNDVDASSGEHSITLLGNNQ